MKTSKVKGKSDVEKESSLWSVLFFFKLKSDCALVALLYNPVGFHEGGDLG